MKTLSRPARGKLVEPLAQAERIVVPAAEPAARWLSSSLRRCACSRCGTHAYRRLRADRAEPLDATGGPATCAVCGGAELVALIASRGSSAPTALD